MPTFMPSAKRIAPEEEPDPEERDHFLQQLYKFMEDRGTPINKPPVLGYKDLNLFKLFRLVYFLGGCHNIESGTVWKQVYMDLGIPVRNFAASCNVKRAYMKYLYGFEEYCRSASITFRTIHHNNPRSPSTPVNQKTAAAELIDSTPIKMEPFDDHGREVAESGSESEKEEVKDRHSSPRVTLREKPLSSYLLNAEGEAACVHPEDPLRRHGATSTQEAPPEASHPLHHLMQIRTIRLVGDDEFLPNNIMDTYWEMCIRGDGWNDRRE